MGDRWRHARRLVARRVHGRVIVVRVPSLETEVLNALGSRIWELAPGHTSEEIVAALLPELEVGEAELARDVGAFLVELEDLGLVERSA